MNEIAANIGAVSSRIAKAARENGRAAHHVRLMAVTKSQTDEKIRDALIAGQRLFGENKVQEAEEHWEALRAEYPDITLHLIGPLQTNKVKQAVKLFDAIQTVDREKLAKALSEEMKKQGRPLPCFIQVNTGEEPQKAGVKPQDFKPFVRYCRDECGLHIVGLMCVPPSDQPAGLHFALLKKLAAQEGIEQLSMGMTGDFERAVPLGATIVRVGTALFGGR